MGLGKSWKSPGDAAPRPVSAWAERTPDAPAVIQEQRVLSYGELRLAAERLARRLRALGVGPEVRVAVCLDETIERVVAILGVLRAGGAWVPVDPAYPPERVARMLDDPAAPVLVTREALLPLLPPTTATALCVDGDSVEEDIHLPALAGGPRQPRLRDVLPPRAQPGSRTV